MQKIKIDHHAKFRDKDKFFPYALFPVRAIFTPYFHFRCVARATFDRKLIHSFSYGVCRFTLVHAAKIPFQPP